MERSSCTGQGPSALVTRRFLVATRAHLKSFWPNGVYREETWPQGPILRTIPHFRVACIQTNEVRVPFIYCTIGCSSVVPLSQARQEFFMISPEKYEPHVETLAMLANYHADEQYRLDLGQVIKIGSPWMSDSTCDHLLMSLPYPFGPKLEWLKLEFVSVRFIWALPITSREAAFAQLHGTDALEEKFDAAGIDYTDLHRLSIA